MSKWKVAVYLAAIFVAGSVSGWVIATRTLKQQAFTAPRSDEIAASLRTCLRTRLQLSEEQDDKIDAIIERSSKEMQSIHKERVDRIRQAVSNRNSQIMALLNPDQQKHFEQIEKERIASWRNKDKDKDKDSSRSKHGGKAGRDGRRSSREKSASNTVVNATNAVLDAPVSDP